MKKNFIAPEMQISAFALENIVLTSGVTAVNSVLENAEFSADEENTTVTIWSEMVATL